MFGPWVTMTMLAAESQQVIWMRCAQFAAGGPDLAAEAERMIAEKMTSGLCACAQIMTGASPDSVMKSYRHTVRANVRRLSK